MIITFVLFRILFIIGSIKFLFLRKEETPIPKPKCTLDSSDQWTLLCFHTLYLIIALFFICWLSLELISILLIRGGVESNPGPKGIESEISPTCKKNEHGLCGISHLCEVVGCDVEVFASCHCDSCEGYGPLLCYNHFLNDSCKMIKTKHIPSSTLNCKKSNVSAFASTPVLIKSGRLGLRSEKELVNDWIECTTCYNHIPISNIGLSSKCWLSLKRAKGYFHYTCVACITNSSGITDNSSITFNEPHATSSIENLRNLSHIIVHKRRKLTSRNAQSLMPKQSAIIPKTPVCATNTAIAKCPALTSLILKPPPIQILKKWWKILEVPGKSPTRSALPHVKNESSLSTCISKPLSNRAGPKFRVQSKFGEFNPKVGESNQYDIERKLILKPALPTSGMNFNYSCQRSRFVPNVLQNNGNSSYRVNSYIYDDVTNAPF